MLFYDQLSALGQFQGVNNTTHECRINNIAPGGSINFMIGSSSQVQIALRVWQSVPGRFIVGARPWMVYRIARS